MPAQPSGADARAPSRPVPPCAGPRPLPLRLRRLALPAAGLAAAAWVARPLAALAAAGDRLPQWDPAKYGVAGLRLAAAVRDAAPLRWLAEVNAQEVWPPLVPLAESVAFLVGGPGYGVPRLLMVGLFVVAAWAAWSAGAAVERPCGAARAAIAGALTAALWISSPFVHLFAVLTMLEVAGACALFVAVAAYARWLRTGRLGDLRRAALAALLLFFVKYNYGLLWIVPMLLHEAWDDAGTLRALAARLRGALVRLRWRRPWTLFLVVYAALLVSIPLSGGWRFEVAGRRVVATSLGNPVYALYVLVLLRLALLPALRRRWAEGWRALAPRFRVLATWIGLPVALWMLVPRHTKSFFAFVENRASHLPWGEQVALYPRAFVDLYSAAPWVGWAVLGAALVPLLRLGRLAPARRAVGLALVVGLAALVLHPYKLPRFLFTVASLVWLAAAFALAEAVGSVAQRLPRRWSWGPAALVVAGVLALTLVAGVDGARLEAGFAERTVDPAVRPLLDAVADSAAAEPRGSVVAGTWNQLSPGLVEWHLRQRHPGVGEARVPRRAEDLVRTRGTAPELAAEALLDRVTADAGRLFVIDALAPPAAATTPEWRAAFAAESAWLDPLRAAIGDDPRLRLVTETVYPVAGYRLRSFAVRTSSP